MARTKFNDVPTLREYFISGRNSILVRRKYTTGTKKRIRKIRNEDVANLQFGLHLKRLMGELAISLVQWGILEHLSRR